MIIRDAWNSLIDCAPHVAIAGYSTSHASDGDNVYLRTKSAEAVIKDFFEPLESAYRDLKSFLSDDSQAFMPSGISVNLQLTISALGKFAGGELEEKAADLIAKLEKLLDFVDRL